MLLAHIHAKFKLMKFAACIALASAAITLANTAKADDAQLARRQLMADQFMKSFCFTNSWPRGIQATHRDDGTTQFSALILLKDRSVVRRIFSIADSELHALHQAAYTRHMTDDDLSTLTRFCSDDNTLLKSALEKKNAAHRNNQLLNTLKNDPTFAKLAPAFPAAVAAQKPSLTAQEEDALAAFRNSPEVKSAVHKIQSEIDPEVGTAIWAIGKARGTETTRLYDDMPPKP